jgi:hypothetical protein
MCHFEPTVINCQMDFFIGIFEYLTNVSVVLWVNNNFAIKMNELLGRPQSNISKSWIDEPK